MRLISEWKTVAWRLWSTRLLAIAWFILAIPYEAFLTVYSLVPPDLQMLLPGRTAIVLTIMFMALVARLIHQPKLEAKIAAKEANRDP